MDTLTKKIVVTGGAGFIGSHLVDALIAKHYQVIVVDDLSTGRIENISPTASHIMVDICDKSVMEKVCAEADTVYHLAAKASVPKSMKDPDPYMETNVIGTYRMLEAAKAGGVKNFVFASSSSVYGNNPSPKREHMPIMPLSPYALTKACGEELCKLYNRLSGMSCVALRFFNVYGPRQREDSEYAAVVPKFISSTVKGTPCPIYGDGEQRRDFTFVSDVVNACLLAGDFTATSNRPCVFNVGSGQAHTVNELARLLNTTTPVHLPSRAGDVRHSEAGLCLASSVLGYSAKVPFSEGVGRTLQWRKTC